MRKIQLLCLMFSLFCCHHSMAQINVRGTVTDATGEGLVGVTVIEKGTNAGAITDIDGNYSINVSGSNAVLVFSYVGFVSQEIPVNSRTTVDISLDQDVTELGEIVVTALGFKQNKDRMGSTTSSIQADDVTRSGEVSVGPALAAKASNVIVNQSTGDPGAGSTIKIRGSNSISGTTSPLIILDGIPISNTTFYGTGGGNSITGGRSGGTVQQSRLNDINPTDIESITVLKGASAASLWGSRAANGVIVINTKNGRAGKVKINYKATFSFDEVLERIPMQNTYGQGTNGNQSETVGESWGDYIPDRSGAANTVDESGGFFTAHDGTVYYPIVDKNSTQTFNDENWDAVFQTGGFEQHDLSVSGGNENATYFLSLGRLDQEGIIRNSDYTRTSLRLNSRFVLNDWLTASTKAGYINSSNNRIQQSSNTAGLLLGLLRQAPDFDSRDYIGTYTSASGEQFNNRHRAYRDQIGSRSTAPAYNNPLWTIFEQVSDAKVDRFTMAGQFDITPNDWMQWTIRGGVDTYTDTRNYFFPVHSAGDRNPGVYAEDLVKERELNLDVIGRANYQVNDDVTMQATLGFNINDRDRNYVHTRVTGFLANVRKQTADLNSDNASSLFNNSKRFIRSNRGFAILNFGLFNQLDVTTSGTVEAASSVKGSFFYPSVDASWQLSEFLDLSNSPISFAKLRASWGKVGVQPSAHRFETTAEGGFTYTSYDSELGIALHGGGFRLNDDLGNQDLEPEIKTEWEIGADIRLFDDKTNLTMTYYQNEIDGLLIDVDLSPSSGFDTQYTNGATMENKGFEMELTQEIYNRNDLSVSAFANWSRNRNEVTNLLGTETINLSPGASVSSRAIVGEQLGVLYGTGSQTNADGSFILDDNGFPQLTLSPVVLGDPNPDWRGALGINVGYKGFAMNALIEHSHGGEFSPRTLWVLRRFGTTQETANTFVTQQELTNYDGDVIPTGTRVRGNIADFGGGAVLLDETFYRHGIGGGFGDNQLYNFSIVSAQYTRLRELSFSYTITSGFIEKLQMSSVVLTATGRNLFLWDDIEGIDPQVNQTGVGNAQGLDYFTNPTAKSYLFSIAVNF